MFAKLTWTIGLILQDDDKILLIKRQNTWYFDWYWWFPAWRLEESEHFTDWVIREAYEEIWISINKKELSKPLIVHSISIEKEHIHMYFGCKKNSHNPINNEPLKCSEIKWFNKTSLPDNCTPGVTLAMQYFFFWERYIEVTI